MTAYCLGTCNQYKARKPIETGRYAAGQKRCNNCRIFIICDGIFCPCCKQQLRTLPRNRKAKGKVPTTKSGIDAFISSGYSKKTLS